MPILKRLKQEAKKVKRGFSVTTGIGLRGKEKEKFERLKAERKKVKYERDLASYKRQVEIESLKTKIHKTKEARIRRQPQLTGRRRMGIRETPSMFLDDFSPISYYGKKPKPTKTKKVKKRKKKSRKKRRRVIEYY